MQPLKRSRPLTQLGHRRPIYFALRDSLLDHLVRAREQHGRHFEAERLRGLQVDNELEPGRLLNRQVGRLLALVWGS